ncbi:MAG: aspartate kinase [Armatimonadota bacterium]|nr:aspartate kinase [Armatimonadota bacterium]MDR5703807.1 aspartate kinase [Armatimonadota bacterium]
MRILVQKFGGTTLATQEGRELAAEAILWERARGYTPVAVVSAPGREGDPYATDTLLGLAKDLGPELDPRTLDLLLSCGETISAALLTLTLLRKGCPAVALTGAQAGIITTGEFGNARILRVDPRRILASLQQGKVVVVAGFQGVSEDGEVTTLGRGGSDTTAVALGAALKAERVELYKDVDGVMTADPRLVPNAQPIRKITYDEIAQMAWLGARVIHPRAVDIARFHRVRLVIRRLSRPGHVQGEHSGSLGPLPHSPEGSGEGTVLVKDPDPNAPSGHPFAVEGEEEGSVSFADGRVVVGLAHIPHLAQIALEWPPEEGLGRVLDALTGIAAEGISIDLITLLPGRLLFTIEEGVSEKAERLLLARGFRPQIRRGCAKVSVVGAGMRGVPGVMARVVKALYHAGVEILQTADSHTTISCLVPQEKMKEALCALHEEFITPAHTL